MYFRNERSDVNLSDFSKGDFQTILIFEFSNMIFNFEIFYLHFFSPKYIATINNKRQHVTAVRDFEIVGAPRVSLAR